MTILQHFICQVKHGDIELDTQYLTKIGKIIKEVGIPPLEVDRNDITVGFDTLHDKGLFPIQVTDDPILPTRTKPCGKHDELIVRSKSRLHHSREVFGLLSRLVDGDAKRRQSVQVHQQVVDHIFHLATIKGAQDITQCHSILPTQGMVGHKSIKPFFRQIFLPLYHNIGIKELQTSFQEIYTDFIFRLPQKDIQFLLMNDMLQIRNHELGDILRLLRSLFPKYLVYVNQK